MGGGNDTVFGTEFADTITPGNGDDTVNGNAGDDTLVWNPGEASDVMNGGDGRDTVVDNGGGGDEQFVVKPQGRRPDARRRVAHQQPVHARHRRREAGGQRQRRQRHASPATLGVAGLIKTEMNGGDGNDALVGTDGNDVQRRRRRQRHDHRRQAATTTWPATTATTSLIWNPGEGTDKFEGGAGNDIAQDNGGAGGEHFIVSANGQRVTATRDNGAPFFLDIGTIETLDLNTAGGDDSVDVNDGLGALIKVDANLGDGNDTIRARNDSAQVIDGAAGTDTATVDATDQVNNVEKVSGNGQAQGQGPSRSHCA